MTTLETTPKDATRSPAARVGLNQTAVSRIWRAFGLKPHKVDTFKIGKDSLSVDEVRDVVGLYLNPPAKVVVLCVDEKSQIQPVERFFAEITVKLLRRGVHRSVTDLEHDIRQWIEQWNTNPRPYTWTRTADESTIQGTSGGGAAAP